MRVKGLFIVSAIILSLGITGCGGSKPAPAKKQTKQKTQKKHKFVVGKTTKDEVIAALGEPSGRSVNSKGEEVLTYRSGHPTGKAWIPFYYGRDRWRTEVKTYTFKNNILVDYAESSQHY